MMMKKNNTKGKGLQGGNHPQENPENPEQGQKRA